MFVKLFQPAHEALPACLWSIFMKLFQHVCEALPACSRSSSSMFVKLFQPVHEALPACLWSSYCLFMKLFQHVHEAHPACSWSSSSMFMKVFQHVREALPACSWGSSSLLMKLFPIIRCVLQIRCTRVTSATYHDHITVSTRKAINFQFNNCSHVTIRLGLSVTVPEIMLLSQTNCLPDFVPLFIFRFHSVFLTIFFSMGPFSDFPAEKVATQQHMEQ